VIALTSGPNVLSHEDGEQLVCLRRVVECRAQEAPAGRGRFSYGVWCQPGFIALIRLCRIRVGRFQGDR
jgi:hypothetical protein